MLKLLILSTIQSLCLVSAQVFLKLAMSRMDSFAWKWSYFKQLIENWQLAASGISIVAATILWLHIIRNYPFSVAYPLISISYVFGMLAAVLVFGEAVPLLRWIGVALIVGGVICIAK